MITRVQSAGAAWILFGVQTTVQSPKLLKLECCMQEMADFIYCWLYTERKYFNSAHHFFLKSIKNKTDINTLLLNSLHIFHRITLMSAHFSGPVDVDLYISTVLRLSADCMNACATMRNLLIEIDDTLNANNLQIHFPSIKRSIDLFGLVSTLTVSSLFSGHCRQAFY